ncbi:MAG TPA: IS200/IS605 family transposase [Ktedonobacteraceae bacterium]|nr:IS200/IS605 family transposase [Ktedonobacteraceae bacterium]
MREVYKSNNNTFFRCVWRSNYRRSVLVDGADDRLKESITQICNAFHVIIEELEVIPDQVYFLVSIDPPFGMHRLVKARKGRSSRFLRQAFPSLVSLLSLLNSSFVATVGGGPLEIVKSYLKEQNYV